jgi:hypothetical protein
MIWKSFFLYYAGDTVYAAFPFSQSVCQLVDIFSTLRVEIFLLVDGWNPFFITRGYSLRSIPIRVKSASWLIFFLPLGSKYSCWWMVEKSFFFITQDTVYAAFPFESVSLPAGWYFSTLRVEIFLLVDGWNPFSLLRRDTVCSIPVESSQSASWMIFYLPLGSKYSCWWMVGNPFLYYAGIQSTFPFRFSLPAGWYFLPLGSNILAGGWLEILFFITQGYSLQHPQSSRGQSASWMIFFYP